MVDERRVVSDTFDLSIEDAACFFANGLLVHNTRKDRLECLGEDLYGDVIDDIKRADLIKSGHVLDVQIRVIPTAFEADWYGMPTDERPEREVDITRLRAEIQEDFARNELILSCVMSELPEQVLVLSHRREHCMMLDQRLVGLGAQTGFLIGGDDYRTEFRKSVASIESGAIRVGVGTFDAIGQGIDLPGVSVGVCCTPIASNKQVFNQVRGRFCRTAAGKTTARLYYLWDRKVFGLQHLQNICAWNANVVLLQDERWVDARQYLKRHDA